MDDEVKNEDNQEETKEETTEENNEEVKEETNEETKDNEYVNDDEVEMLKSIEKRFNALETKLDNMISMVVDSGAIIQDSVDTFTESDKENYKDDFIDIDELDLKL